MLNLQKIELLTHQKSFLQCQAEEAMLLGGIGCGKSDCGAFFATQMIAEYPESPGIVVAPTYQQLIKATVKAITKVFNKYNIKHKAILSGADKRIEMPGRESIHLFSLQDPDNFRGPEAGWLLGDEICFASEYSVKVAKGRIRDKRGPLFKRFTSSPAGYNWAYDKFENMDGENATKKVELIRAKTSDNIFLPDSYYESLLEDYGGADNPLAQQELFGLFVDMVAGSIYWGFQRDIHVQPCKLDDNFPVYVGIDFNANNMTACYVQYRDGCFYACDEVVLNHYGANTDNMATRVCKDLKSKYQVIMIPDSTGKAVKSSARGRSDLDILKSYELEIKKTKNPFIRDRQNNLNIHFKKNKLIINKSCKEIIKELGTLSSREKEGDIAHVSVALGYVLWAIDPITTRPKSTWH